MKNFVILFLSAGILGCSNPKGVTDLSRLFGAPDQLVGKDLLFPADSIADPYLMEVHADKVYFVDMGTPFNVTIIGLTDNSVDRAVGRGRGPGEILWATSVSASDTILSLFDNNLATVFNYGLMSGKVVADANKVETVILASDNEKPMKAIGFSGGYVATGITNDGRQFVEYDKAGAVVRTFDEYPQNPEHAEDEGSLPMGYQGHMVSAANRNGFVWGGSDGAMFKFFTVGKDGFENAKEYILEHPVYIWQNTPRGSGIISKAGNRAGVISVKSAGDRYYFLYSGSVFGEGSTYMDAISGDNIFVFDNLGKPVKHYKLDRKVRLFGIDRSGNELICYAIDAETKLPILLSYELK